MGMSRHGLIRVFGATGIIFLRRTESFDPVILKQSAFFLSVLLFTSVSGWGEEWQNIAGGRWRELKEIRNGSAGFQIQPPERTGVLFTNLLREEMGATNRALYNGSGVAAGDVDGDGWPDIVFAGLEGKLSL